MSDKEKIIKDTANSLSDLLINKILAEEIDIVDSMQITSYTLTYLVGKLLTDQQYEECMEDSSKISGALLTTIKDYKNSVESEGKDLKLPPTMLALGSSISYLLDKTNE